MSSVDVGTLVGECSLGHLVERYIDSQVLEPGLPREIASKPQIKMESLRRFLWVMESEEHGPALRALFTDSQRHSSQLIWEWVLEKAQQRHPLFRPSTRRSRLRGREIDNQPLDRSTDFKGEVYPERAGTIRHFDFSMELLVGTEFEILPDWWRRSSKHEEVLLSVRREASLKAYCQSLARFCYNSAQDEVYPVSSGSLDDWPRVNSCPWLDENPRQEDNLSGWPRFLFDTISNRTVETQQLNEFPAYSVISHTWGRWREHGNPLVEIEGVPWPIPSNTQFDVRTIPDSFRKHNFNTRYIWMDLVCIPQDESDIAVKEIGRQADIFRNASRAIAWLHDVNDLSCLGALCRWLALSLLLFESGSSQAIRRDRMRDNEWANFAHKPSGLLVPNAEPYTPYSELNPWFTSLWTLQEVCLRPDMLLASSDLQILSIDRNVRVPLSALISIYNNFSMTCGSMALRELHQDHCKNHFALQELSSWYTSSGLAALLQLKRIDILTLGDRRDCVMRRSEAIMSALGMTAWFHQTPREQHESNLVLGKYHPAFVEEVRLTIPGEFFGAALKMASRKAKTGSSDSVPSENPFLLQDDAQVSMAMIKQYQWATLLPFSAFSTSYLNIGKLRGSSLQSHDTLRSWEIRQSGEVHIPKVCLLASSSQGVAMQPTQLLCKFHGFRTSVPGGPKADTYFPFELNQWVHTRPYEVHAVVTSFVASTKEACLKETLVTKLCEIFGVVLRKLDDGSFFKIGHFHVLALMPVALPDVLEVDWTVI